MEDCLTSIILGPLISMLNITSIDQNAVLKGSGCQICVFTQIIFDTFTLCEVGYFTLVWLEFFFLNLSYLFENLEKWRLQIYKILVRLLTAYLSW